MSQDDRPLLVIRVSSSDYLAIYSCTPFHFQTSKPVFRSTIDTQLQKSTPPNDVQSLTRDLQLCTDDIKSWMCSSQLKLNEDKTEAILFSKLSLPSDCLPSPVTVGTHQIAFSDKVRNLGFILDSNLTMKQHVIKVCQTAYYEPKRISSIRSYLTEDATKSWLPLVYCLV